MLSPKDLESYIINESETVLSALKKIDITAGSTLLAIDSYGTFVGTITDGDIRRSLLKGIKLESNLSDVVNTNPIIARHSTTNEERKSLLHRHKITILPIVDIDGSLIGAELSQKYTEVQPYDAVIMCGGLGSRLGELTRECPKPMLKIDGVPILERILCRLAECGIVNFFFAANYLREKIENYFGNGEKWGVKIQYLRETKRLGTGGALSLLPYTPEHPFLVMNADILTSFNVLRLFDFHNMCAGIATLGVVRHSYQNPYGVIRKNGTTLVGIDEKPIESCFINAGIYIVEPRFIQSVPHNTFIDMPTLLLQAKDRGEIVSICPICEDWIDIGRESDYYTAQQMIFP